MGPIWATPYGIVHMGPMMSPVALPIWVPHDPYGPCGTHMGPIYACLLGYILIIFLIYFLISVKFCFFFFISVV